MHGGDTKNFVLSRYSKLPPRVNRRLITVLVGAYIADDPTFLPSCAQWRKFELFLPNFD